MTVLNFRLLPGRFAICRLPPDSALPDWGLRGAFTSVTRASEELSVVCPLENVPAQYKPDVPWACLKLEGPFAFSQAGILKSFIDPLVEDAIPIFAIATFDTDYVLVQENFVHRALTALKNAGHYIVAG